MSNLPPASIEKLGRQIATINQWPKREVDEILQDHPDKALELVLTLKHYANPSANYPIHPAIDDELEYIKKALRDPKWLQNGHLEVTPEERDYLINLMRIKLDALANEIMLDKKIDQKAIENALFKNLESTYSPSPPSAAPPLKEQLYIQAWWDKLSEEEKRAIYKRHNNLNETQRIYLTQRINYYSSSYNYNPEVNAHQDLLSYYQMCLIGAQLNYLTYYTMFNLSGMVLRGLICSTGAAMQIGASLGGHSHVSNHGNSSNDGLALGAILAFIALGLSAVIGCAYALKKTFNSVRNIFCGEKILRSFYRLVGTAGGGYLGVFAGAAIGGILGSAIPGIGTAAGVILGMIFGVCIGAGMGALMAKYSAKLISYLLNKEELNPTNPNKWRLNSKQRIILEEKKIDVNQVKADINRIKTEKEKIGLEGSFFFTQARKKKNKLNKELSDLKEGNILNTQYPPRYGFFYPPIKHETAAYDKYYLSA